MKTRRHKRVRNIYVSCTDLSVLSQQLRRLRQRPVDGRAGAGAPGRRGRRHQRLPRHGRPAVRAVLHDGRAGRRRAPHAHLLHLLRQSVHQPNYLGRRRRGRDTRYEDAAVVDRWTDTCYTDTYCLRSKTIYELYSNL